jgi:dynein heavy chain
MVNVMLGDKEDWETVKKNLANINFLERLINYDKDHISEKTLKKLDKFVENPDSKVDNLKKASKAVASLGEWLHALHAYARGHDQ